MPKEEIDPNLGYYNKANERIIKDKKVKYQSHHQTFTDMSIKQLLLIRANTRVLVWEYLSAAMDYDNLVHPQIGDMAEIIKVSRQKTSKALKELSRDRMIVCVGGNARGRGGRKWMINPYYRNRGGAQGVKAKRKKWDEFILEEVKQDPAYQKSVQEANEKEKREIEEHIQAGWMKRPERPPASAETGPDDPMPF